LALCSERVSCSQIRSKASFVTYPDGSAKVQSSGTNSHSFAASIKPDKGIFRFGITEKMSSPWTSPGHALGVVKCSYSVSSGANVLVSCCMPPTAILGLLIFVGHVGLGFMLRCLVRAGQIDRLCICNSYVRYPYQV